MPTGISYLDETWNPVTGCSGKGCKVRDRCWAKDIVRSFPAIHYERFVAGFVGIKKIHARFNEVQFHPERLEKPLHWRKPRRVGVGFMGDLFDEMVDPNWYLAILSIVHKCPKHTFLFLTKQPHNVIKRFTKGFLSFHIPQNVYWGVSITDQEDADRMIPELLKIPGKHWVSVEPMLGPINLREMAHHDDWHIDALDTPNPDYSLKWVVLGCESGPGRRPCKLEWMIDVVEQCKAAQVPIFVKQVNLWNRVSHNLKEWPEELRVQELPK